MKPRTWAIHSADALARLSAYLASLPVDEHPIDVTVCAHKAQRSLPQNARLWKLHQLAADVTGHSAEEMHEFALCRYFGSETVTCGKIAMVRPMKRSSVRNTAEFADFMTATEAWYATEFGVWLD